MMWERTLRGVSNCEVSVSDRSFGHSQAGSSEQMSKKWLASMMKQAARCSSLRLANASL